MHFSPAAANVRNIVAVAVSPNRKYVACVEDTEESLTQQVSECVCGEGGVVCCLC